MRERNNWPLRTQYMATVWLIWIAHFSVGILLLHHYGSDLAHLSYLYSLFILLYKSERLAKKY